jgi:hypothetical protein
VSAESFATSIDRLLNQVRHWEQARWWSRPPAPGGPVLPTRADLVYALVQRLADRGADAETRPPRPVPRVSDLVLPDQIRVMADDLLAADASGEKLTRAAEDVETLRRRI